MRLKSSKLRELSYKKNINQTKLAELTGVNRITINNIFCGRATTEETALKIATALNVPIETITARE